ncbi:MAG: hypothetical protein RMX68_024385 [Aulosira sp. ZfuVER01]|nr:hypothetical protein [Aulosira sp. DedVER01a]MDZ8056326.1 hypothetical protein [Aulosira sp. ZfuCHP01]
MKLSRWVTNVCSPDFSLDLFLTVAAVISVSISCQRDRTPRAIPTICIHRLVQG